MIEMRWLETITHKKVGVGTVVATQQDYRCELQYREGSYGCDGYSEPEPVPVNGKIVRKMINPLWVGSEWQDIPVVKVVVDETA